MINYGLDLIGSAGRLAWRSAQRDAGDHPFAVWKNFGYNMVILLAGLQVIPADLYEAARIDGANATAALLVHVTLPALGRCCLLWRC